MGENGELCLAKTIEKNLLKMNDEKIDREKKEEEKEGAFSSSRPLLSLKPMVHTH